MRTDLLALTDDSLAAIANRGLLKRAQREVAAGAGPTLVEDDGTVTATFADGVVVVLARGTALDRSSCTCAATGVCRHRVMLAVAYREQFGTAGNGGEAASDEALSDEALSDEALSDEALSDVLSDQAASAGRSRTGEPTSDHPATGEVAAAVGRDGSDRLAPGGNPAEDEPKAAASGGALTAEGGDDASASPQAVGRDRGTGDGAARLGTGVAPGDQTSVGTRPGTTAAAPVAFSDKELEEHFGSRTMAVARKAWRAGYRARIHWATPAEPVATVELASCTVRFLVAGELGYARVDAARGTRDDAVVLAVWACRAAERLGRSGPVVDLEVGGAGVGEVGAGRSGAGHSGLEPILPLVGDLLADGVTGTGPEIATAVAQARRSLEGANLRWPADALDELDDQLGAYRDRNARYHPVRTAALVAEAFGRHRCVAGGGASLRVTVLGTEERAETPLRLLRLTGLGARVVSDPGSRTVEVYLAHPEAGVVLALRRRVEVTPDDDDPASGANAARAVGHGATTPSPASAPLGPPASRSAGPLGPELGRRKAGGARLSALAGANVVTESAVRSANRVVRIAESRVAKTTVSPSAGGWEALPPSILVADLEAEAERLVARPPAVVRARVVAESVRAVVVDAIRDVQYLPGEQQLVATIDAPRGSARLVLTHDAAAPGAVDALFQALQGEDPVRFVAGHLRRHHGGLELEPTAVVTGTTVLVPAFAESAAEALPTGVATITDPLAAAVAEATEVSAQVVHQGYRHLRPSWSQRAARAADQLTRVGLTAAGAAVADLADVARYGGADLPERWADTHLRLLVTAEQL